MEDITRQIATSHATLLNTMTERLEAVVTRVSGTQQQQQQQQNSDEVVVVHGQDDTTTRRWRLWTWGGKMGRFVPQGFTFPQGFSVKTVWDLWYHGNEAEGIRPLRILHAEGHQDDLKTECERG